LEAVDKKLYEAMFLVDSAQAASDWDGTLGAIEHIMKRADAEIVILRKWGERKLAYEIKRKNRGTYFLCYFKADGEKIAGIEKDVQLSEKILRVLILSTENRLADFIEKDINATAPEEAHESEAVNEDEELNDDTLIDDYDDDEQDAADEIAVEAAVDEDEIESMSGQTDLDLDLESEEEQEQEKTNDGL
jgi:small subunit ribosomal protein S6